MEPLIYHLLYEFGQDYHRSKKILNETRGIVSDLHEVVKILCSKVFEQVADCIKLKNELTVVYDGAVKGSFFEDYHLELTTIYNQETVKPNYSGGFITRYSFTDTEDGIKCSPHIHLTITCNDAGKMLNTVSFCLG